MIWLTVRMRRSPTSSKTLYIRWVSPSKSPRSSARIAPEAQREKADAVLFDGEVDICGAGDTSLSAFSAAIAAKTELKAAAQFAGLASGVTVRKIGVTGTASPEEIEALAQ